MNERIRELAEQATVFVADYDGQRWQIDTEKFAELIVKECMEINKQELSFIAFETLMDRYNEHFGVKE